MNHKFHYHSPKQVAQWIQLHERYSPFHHDAACAALYRQALAESARRIGAGTIHLISLGCGSGDKDLRLLRALRAAGSATRYTPTDVSAGMALTAWRKAVRQKLERVQTPVVFDLATARDAADLLAAESNGRRLFTFFGMIPNFEPRLILRRLNRLCVRGDWLLAGANLLPGRDPKPGSRTVLPQYDNPPTRTWLGMALADLGIERKHGTLRFSTRIPRGGAALRIQADFHFSRECRVLLPGRQFHYHPGECLRVFFSDRHTPGGLTRLFRRHGFSLVKQWITTSDEEGIFLLRRD